MQEIFGPDGLISKAHPEYEHRPGQIEMAAAVMRAFEQKQHLIVGHDTDALSNPLEASMPWIVKWEKEEFVGRRSLSVIQAAAAQHLTGPVGAGVVEHDHRRQRLRLGEERSQALCQQLLAVARDHQSADARRSQH